MIDQLVDVALSELASRLAANWKAWPAALHGARIYFVVEEEPRTLALDAERPRLYSGIAPLADAEQTPFLLFRLTLPQLYGLLGSEAQAERLTAEGNEPALLTAIAACLDEGG